MVFMSSKLYREGILKFKVSENTDLALSRVFVSKIICQNLSFRYFFFCCGTIDDSISYFSWGTGSTGFTVYQQPFFSVTAPGR